MRHVQEKDPPHGGYSVSRRQRRGIYRARGVRLRLRPPLAAHWKANKETHMNVEYLIVGLIALAVGIYLAIALLWPDRF
jgi:hypothetical protein